MVAAVAYLDRSNVAIAAPLLKGELGLSNVELGVVFSAFSLGYAATQPIAGRLADRFGAYRIIALGVVVWSVLTAVTASIPAGFGFAFLAVLGVRFALGVSEAVIFPASNRMVANWMPSSERGLANGLIFAGVGVGAGIAPPLITTISGRQCGPRRPSGWWHWCCGCSWHGKRRRRTLGWAQQSATTSNPVSPTAVAPPRARRAGR